MRWLTIAHHLPELIFIAGVHDRDGFRIAIPSLFIMMINSTEHNHVAANPSARLLNYRSANRRHVAFDGAFDDHVATKRHRAFLDGSGDPNRLAHPKHGRINHTVDDPRLWINRMLHRDRLAGRCHDEKQQQARKGECSPQALRRFQHDLICKGG